MKSYTCESISIYPNTRVNPNKKGVGGIKNSMDIGRLGIGNTPRHVLYGKGVGGYIC
jgi:hypothetical protein